MRYAVILNDAKLDPVEDKLAALYLEADGVVREALVWATLEEARGDWSYQKALIVRAQLLEELRLLGARIEGLEMETLSQFFRSGVQDAIADLSGQGIAAPRLQAARFNPKAIEAIARDLTRQRGLYLGTIGSNPGSILRQADDYLRQLSASEITRGLIMGDSPRRVGARLRERAIAEQRIRDAAEAIDQAGTVGFFDNSGRQTSRQSLHYYGQMAARTGMARARAEGAMAVHQEAGIEVYQVSRHGTLCFICRPFEGKVFRYEWSTSPEYQRFPICPRTAPFHPQCFHTVRPISFPEDYEPPTAGEMEILEGTNATLYRYMRDVAPDGKELMQAAGHGFATQRQWNTWKRMGARENIPEGDLRGPRWRYRGIESRRPAAIRRMLEQPGLKYKDAMEEQTLEFMKTAYYRKQRPKSLTPAAQRTAVEELLFEEQRRRAR